VGLKGNWLAGTAGRYSVYRGAAQDALRQDHAAAAQGTGYAWEIKGDTTTLEDFTVIAKLREAEEG